MADEPASEPPHPVPGPPSERVADVDRDRTVTALREHVVAGRLTLDEFSERVGEALEARTRGELADTLRDLPANPPAADAAPTLRPASRSHIAVMSGHTTRGRWWLGSRTRAVAVMGGCTMDLRQAEIEGPEVEISATAIWGGIEIIVPEGFEVDLRGFSFMGGRHLRLRHVPRVPGSPRIVVKAVAIMGGIDVKSRPDRSEQRRIARGRRGDATAIAAPELRGDLRGDVRGDPPTGDRHGVRAAPGSESAHRRRPDTAHEVPGDSTVTVLFCDMVGYTRMTEQVGDRISREILRGFHDVVREAVARHGGREISVHGDGFMVAFDSVARSFRCAIDVQRALRGHVPPQWAEPIAAHIGIHTGDALMEQDDLLGRTVIVASRLSDAAGPGEVLVSSLSEQLAQGSGEFAFVGSREVVLKGVEVPQACSSLVWD